jgi:hypothetical protein
MTETTTTTASVQETNEDAIPVHPTDILIALIATFLIPMFLGSSTGDVAIARRAALETVNAYRVRDQADLLAVAQIIAFGLAALGSLSLSMLDDLTLSMTLRLRGNANACNRSAELNRRARAQTVVSPVRHVARPIAPRPQAPVAQPIREPLDEATLRADLAAVRQEVAAVQARIVEQEAITAAAPATTAMPIVTGNASPDITANQSASVEITPGQITRGRITPDQQSKAIWAAAMADVAAEYTAEVATLPPGERWEASMRAKALTQTAKTLLSEANRPPPPGAANGTAAAPRVPI